MISQKGAGRPAEVFLALAMPLTAFAASGQVHAPKPPAKGGVSASSGNALPCGEIRLTQLDGEAEIYSLRAPGSKPNDGSPPIEFTLHAGESRLLNSSNGGLAPSRDVQSFTWGVRPASPPAKRWDMGDRLLHVYAESGPNITMANPVGNDPAGQSEVAASPPRGLDDLLVTVGPCGSVQPVRDNSGRYTQAPPPEEALLCSRRRACSGTVDESIAGNRGWTLRDSVNGCSLFLDPRSA